MVHEPLGMQLLLLSEEVAERIDVITKALRELTPERADFLEHRILHLELHSAVPREYRRSGIVPTFKTDCVHDFQNDTVRDVSTVPGQQKVHAVYGGQSEVQGIRRGFVGKGRLSKDAISESSRRWSDAEDRDVPYKLQSRTGSGWIAAADLEHDQLGDPKVEPVLDRRSLASTRVP